MGADESELHWQGQPAPLTGPPPSPLARAHTHTHTHTHTRTHARTHTQPHLHVYAALTLLPLTLSLCPSADHDQDAANGSTPSAGGGWKQGLQEYRQHRTNMVRYPAGFVATATLAAAATPHGAYPVFCVFSAAS